MRWHLEKYHWKESLQKVVGKEGVSGNNNQIAGNTCSGNGQYGVEIEGSQNRIDGNNVGNNTSYGIMADNPNVTNTITRNASPGLGYGNTSGNNDYAPIQTPNTATSPWADF
jgi:parallel beta-helix repeat protein